MPKYTTAVKIAILAALTYTTVTIKVIITNIYLHQFTDNKITVKV